jgi:hypothetical protein
MSWTSKPSKGTTRIGYKNPKGQVVIRKTRLPGTDHLQYVYVLKCKHCGREYGTNWNGYLGQELPLLPGRKGRISI